ncbi:DegT/DnrJ/EryC1/StrS family aminotransferase [Pedobacter xixiisoli]|uniref:dTDP-4-amino-4,6-dideoxygalactose transaminase n=1 Tax=Pedobacter xixiisoli TaxID=1476464 RepID=A0A286AEL3_9SPHI|nr:DegT/DnrJ/EryC1/StrS family aminotransferase [Pedobacter xixiisoli]SOD20331.1 dTDP-4-amino-4,6-dideoxygalactose transaminase [Pedobacter xixiisoli]
MADSNIQIPFFDASASYHLQKEEIDRAIQNVLDKGAFINGREVELFSYSLASYLGVNHVVPCANGTDALSLALMALELDKEDEIIIPAFNFIAAAEAVALLGLVPVFVDICENDFNIDSSLIEGKLTSKTRAIMVTHLFGASAQMDEIKTVAEKHNLYIIEDAAQSLGSEYRNQKLGTLGHIGCTSFFPTKNLSCFGDGGAVFTNDAILAGKIKMIANHGQIKKYEHEIIGVNSRLDTLQAAILNVKLHKLNEAIEARRNIANLYHEHLKDVEKVQLPFESPKTVHSFNQYCILLENKLVRDALKEYLKNAGISTMIYYPKPTHLQKAFSICGGTEGDFPLSENACERILALPIFPTLDIQQQHYIINQLKTFISDAN